MSVRRRTDGDVWEELRRTVEDETYLVTITLNRNDKGFGFNIRGGVDHPHVGCDPGIFVTAVKADSVAGQDGRLAIGDRILAVNDVGLDNVTHEEAVMAFRTTDTTISLLVEKGAERRVLDDPPKSPKQLQPSEVDGPPFMEQRDSSLQGTISSFFKTTLGALTLGIMAGSLAVFVGTRVYKAVTK